MDLGVRLNENRIVKNYTKRTNRREKDVFMQRDWLADFLPKDTK